MNEKVVILKNDKKYISLSKFIRPSNFRDYGFRYLWSFVNVYLFKLSPRPFWLFRVYLLRIFGANIGKGVKLDPNIKIFDPRRLSIGDNSWVGPNCELYNYDQITIESDVALAQHVKLYTVSHDIRSSSFSTIHAPILFKNQSWIAADTFVGMGVIINQGAVLAARSSAFKTIPEWTINVGSPAKIIGNRVVN